MPEQPTVKVGDELAIAGHGYYRTMYQVSKVTHITPTGRIVTDKGWVLNPDLTVRGRANRFRKAIPWTKELQEQDRKASQEQHARTSLDLVKWMKIPGDIAVKVWTQYEKLMEKEEQAHAKESK